ncbi:hypothetical protein BH11PLA1_BH11PLA1_10390 [soil metagenome]
MNAANTNEPVPGLKPADWLVRFIVPAYIAFGAVMKYATGSAADLPAAARLIPGSRDLGVLQQVFLISICLELTVVVLLLLHRRWARPLAIVVLAGFAAILIYQLALNAGNCGCFGSSRVSPWMVLGIDGVLLLGAAFLPAARRIPDISFVRWMIITALSGLLIATVFAGVNKGWQGRWSTAQHLDAHRWQGRTWQQIPMFAYTPRAADQRPASPATYPEDHQTWVFYRRTCPHCYDTIQALSAEHEQARKSGVKERLVVVDLPYPDGFEEANGMTPREAPCTDCTKLVALPGTEYKAAVPLVVTFERGVVTGVKLGQY